MSFDDEPGVVLDHEDLVRITERRRSLPIFQPIALPESWEMKPGVPKTRGDCENGPRPCSFVSCRQHLWLVLQQDRPGNPARGAQGETTLRPIGASCTLDVAVKAHSIAETADILGVVPTRIHQIESVALRKARRNAIALGLDADDIMEYLLSRKS